MASPVASGIMVIETAVFRKRFAKLANRDGARAGRRTLNLGIKRLRALRVREYPRVPA